MEINNDKFLLADDISDDDNSDDCAEYEDRDGEDNDSNLESMYIYEKSKNEPSLNYYSYEQDTRDNSPILINVNINKTYIDELNAYFKLNNLFTCIKNDENENCNKLQNHKQKQDMSVSKIIMNNIIDKKLGSFTYHYGNKKSAKAYYTYDYPEIYYKKKL